MRPLIFLRIAPALVLVLIVGALVLAGGNARAATPVYADPGGVCASLSPCFTTIQAAVDNAGPAPAVVNVFPGTYNEQVNLDDMGSAIAGAPGDITIQAVDAAGAAAVGTATITPPGGHAIYSNLSPFPGSVTINGINASTDTAAFEFWTSGNASLIGTDTSGGADGPEITSEGDINITDATSNDNGIGGFDLEAPSAGTVTVSGSTANNNTDSEGFDIETDGDVIVSDSEASGNYDEGFEIDGYESSAASSATFSNVVANNSETDDGIDITAATVNVTNATVNGNADEGVQTVGETLLIDRVTAHENGEDGIDVEGIPTKGYFTDNVTVINSDTRDNVGSGIESLENLTVVSGVVNHNNNVICGNQTAGISSLDDDPNDGEGNWWGAPTGPTHPSNAGGTGDAVLDADNPGSLGAQGDVDFDPFISTAGGSGSAVVGVASTISFEFTSADGTVALQEGPGDETGASPFSVTTDNGTATVGFLSGGTLDVTLTADTVGTANVTVTGPCALAAATLPVAVAAGQAAPTATPTASPAQLPPTGGPASSSNAVPLGAVMAALAVGLAAISGFAIAWRRIR